ncbi:nitroreductase family protein [Pyramidobacter piscolens]|uniref:nitroreductase family protein n=1 Tax=Pyramidobacter piscolens TaxID=638849 RepID=UPI0028F0EF9D|nr:nitroreductase family protein [Pyramidobacter piscolens]
MEFYEVVNGRRITRDFQNKVVPNEVLERILDAGLKAPSHDHLRNWEFVVLRDKKEKENALQYIKMSVKAQLELLRRILINGTPQQKMYAEAMPKQYSMLAAASHVILPFFKTAPGVMKPVSVSSLNPLSSIWCVIENIFLAATAEGLACSMRIPAGDEGIKVAQEVGAPQEYVLATYIGLGYPAADRVLVEQVQWNVKQKTHFGKW